jgi:hypothetical protein
VGEEGARDLVQGAAAVAEYKAILRDVLDKRPSGTRQRLSAVLGKNRSFVTQITNPAYPIPIPAQHLDLIFEVCHLSPAERAAFVDAYGRAHPGKLSLVEPASGMRSLVVHVPDYADAKRNRAVDALVQDLVARVVRFVDDPG